MRLDRIGRLSDEEVVAELVQVKGIGPWTAEMFLIFTLRRLDVWPVGDYGVRVGYGRAYGLPETPTAKELAAPRRPLPALPHRRRLVLLAGRRHQTAGLSPRPSGSILAR